MNEIIVTNNVVPIQSYPTEDGITFYDFKEQDDIQRHLIHILKSTRTFKKSKRDATQVLQNPVITNNIHDAIRRYSDKKIPELLTAYNKELLKERQKIYNTINTQAQIEINQLQKSKDIKIIAQHTRNKKLYCENKWNKIISKEKRKWNTIISDAQEKKKIALEQKYHTEIMESRLITYCSNYKKIQEYTSQLRIPITKYLQIEEDKYIGKEILEILYNAGYKKITINKFSMAKNTKDVTLDITRIRISEKLIAIIENIITNNKNILDKKSPEEEPYTKEESDQLRTKLEIIINILKGMFETQKKEIEETEDYNTQIDKYIIQLTQQTEKIIQTNTINTYIGGSQRNKEYAKVREERQ